MLAAHAEGRDVVRAGVDGEQPAVLEGERALRAEAGGTGAGAAREVARAGRERAVGRLREDLHGVGRCVRLGEDRAAAAVRERLRRRDRRKADDREGERAAGESCATACGSFRRVTDGSPSHGSSASVADRRRLFSGCSEVVQERAPGGLANSALRNAPRRHNGVVERARTVLVVDDEATVRDVVGQYLTRDGLPRRHDRRRPRGQRARGARVARSRRARRDAARASAGSSSAARSTRAGRSP